MNGQRGIHGQSNIKASSSLRRSLSTPKLFRSQSKNRILPHSFKCVDQSEVSIETTNLLISQMISGQAAERFFMKSLECVLMIGREIGLLNSSSSRSPCSFCGITKFCPSESTDQWIDIAKVQLLPELKVMFGGSSALAALVKNETLSLMKRLFDVIRRSPPLSSYQIFMDVIPTLTHMRRAMLLRAVDGVGADVILFFRHWIQLVTALIRLIQKDTTGRCRDEIQRYLIVNVLNLGLSHIDSVKNLVPSIIFSPYSDCRTLDAILDLVGCLQDFPLRSDSLDKEPVTSFVTLVSRALLTSSRPLSLECSKMEERISHFVFQSFKKDNSVFLLSRYIISYFNGSPEITKSYLSCLRDGHLDEASKFQIVQFVCGEMSFVYPSEKMKPSAREDIQVNPTHKIPKLALDVLSQGDVDTDTLKLYPLAFPGESTVNLLLFCVSLLFLSNKISVNSNLLDQYPILSGKPPVLFYLMRYVDWMSRNGHTDTLAVLMRVLRVCGYTVLGELLSNLVDFKHISLVGAGQFGAVYRTSFETAVKFIKIAVTPSERCTFFSALNEALCQSIVLENSFCLNLISCGRTKDHDSFFIESPLYSSNLRTFRKSLPDALNPKTLVQLLVIFSEILTAVHYLHTFSDIVHYDLKLENILVETGKIGGDGNLFLIPKIAIADFGEARIVCDADLCLKNRGTECIKSPEMIALSNTTRQREAGIDRRKMGGTAKPSDIWSLGCLFFELLTGEFLFNDPEGDWLSFYYRLTSDSGVIIDTSIEERLGNVEELIEFLEFILVKDPQRRPHITSVIARFQSVYKWALEKLPGSPEVEIPSIPGLLKFSS
jgi:hypothetical protein